MLKHKKPWIAKEAILRKKNGADGVRQTPWPETIYNHQNSNGTVTKPEKYRSMEQDKKFSDKPTHLWTHRLESRLPGEISTASDTQIIPP